MGLFNQGWMIRCDCCEEPLLGEIGGYTQKQIIEIAKSHGWIKKGMRWFCGEECRENYKPERIDLGRPLNRPEFLQ